MKNSSLSGLISFEFHVAKHLREKYELDELFFSITGNVIFANFYQVRVFTQKINSKRNLYEHLSPGEVNAAGLIDEIFHFAIRKYFKENFPNAFTEAIKSTKENLGENNFDDLLLNFIKVFPPQKVYKNELKPEEYLNQFSGNVQNRELLIEEMILLHLANLNPAFTKLKELFNEEYIDEKKSYKSTLQNLESFFKKEEFKVGKKNLDLFTFLKMPILKHSNSIWDQLEFIKNEWGISIDTELMRKIESGKDLFIESLKFDQQFGGFDGGGGAPTIVPQYKGKQIDATSFVLGKSKFNYAEESTKDYEEFEQFTPDTNWMPKLVLIAKNIYVWLDQLSKKYQREIRTLDRIPIEELEQLKKWNINSLWLIGIWERSNASKRIKHLMGNIDAVASAYSLYDYEIAHDIGGEAAYNVFNQNAKSVGIRLASDMVPNHTGIYSRWVIEHPEYFIQLDYPPFPNYNFTGTNLSEQPGIEIKIEDQYWQMKDAAVVFQRKNINTGEVKYIYHGNDGTNMPWNDTAQLNMLKAEVREAVIQKIFDVARKFSVIRFDAAMTLAKKHFSRLWYPEPGKGGDIPSRSDFALTREEFDELFPKEFWREVVDRINDEMPETLLLAEAFWLMEGYFVRTLGMHRVYNSAFMHMMMKEENSKYRELITNTLEFEPEILKRYVNFMSNPDEETAINQFGTDDKYFGVLLLMCTLPGLPMLAHGQIEGYTEKYGMEYQRAYYNENPKDWLVERHAKEIFPVLGKRYLFAEVDNFWFYDFLDHRKVNENVYAFSNSFQNEKALVIYNNKFESTSGYINFSRQKLKSSNSHKYLTNINVAENFNIKNSDFHFYIFKDFTHQNDYIFNGKDIHQNGLFLSLNGFEYRIFLHFEEIYDQSGFVYNFYKENYGKPIWNVKEKLEENKLIPLQHSFENIFLSEKLNLFLDEIFDVKFDQKKIEGINEKIIDEFSNFIFKFKNHFNTDIKHDVIDSKLNDRLLNLAMLAGMGHIKKTGKTKKTKAELQFEEIISQRNKLSFAVLVIYELIQCAKELILNEKVSDEFPENIRITKSIQNILETVNQNEGFRYTILLNLMLNEKDNFANFEIDFDKFIKLRSVGKIYDLLLDSNQELFRSIMENEFTQTFIDVNDYESVKYFSKERLETFCEFSVLFTFLQIISDKENNKKYLTKVNISRLVNKIVNIQNHIHNLALESKFIYNDFFENLSLQKKSKE